MWRFILLFFVILVICCNNLSKMKQVNISKEAVLSDTFKTFFSQYLPEHWTDKYFDDGSYVKMKQVTDSRIIIRWGNKEFEKIVPDTVLNSVLEERLHFDWKNEDFIVFSFGCGSPCWGALILPLNKGIAATSFMHQYDYDKENNLVARFDSDYESLIVENLKTHDKQIIAKRDSTCESAFAGFCLDSVSLKNKILYYKWSTPNSFAKDKKSKEYRIKINL